MHDTAPAIQEIGGGSCFDIVRLVIGRDLSDD